MIGEVLFAIYSGALFCFGWSLASVYWNRDFVKKWTEAQRKSKELDEQLKQHMAAFDKIVEDLERKQRR